MSLYSYLSVYLWLFLEVVIIDLFWVRTVLRLIKRHCWFPGLMASSHSTRLLSLLSIFVNLMAEEKSFMFASEIQHFFMLIGLLYFGVPGLLIPFTLNIDKWDRVYSSVASIQFFLYLPLQLLLEGQDTYCTDQCSQLDSRYVAFCYFFH